MPQPLTTLDDFVSRHHAEMVAFLCRRTSETRAEELAQEIWVRMTTSEASFPSDQHQRAYAYAIARRLLIDDHRRRRARPVLTTWTPQTVEPSVSDPPDSVARAKQVSDVVEQTLARLKPEVAEVWRMRVESHHAFKDIAAHQGCSLNTALGRMAGATRQLRRALEHTGHIQPPTEDT